VGRSKEEEDLYIGKKEKFQEGKHTDLSTHNFIEKGIGKKGNAKEGFLGERRGFARARKAETCLKKEITKDIKEPLEGRLKLAGRKEPGDLGSHFVQAGGRLGGGSQKEKKGVLRGAEFVKGLKEEEHHKQDHNRRVGMSLA